MSGLVSIIMPSYNTGEYIAESIESVLRQTYQNWELIIVDDCSNDNTDDVVNPFLKDARILYMKNKKNSGAAVSRNRALQAARGKWVAFLDSDDLWMPDKLSKQITFMEKNGYHFSYTNYAEMDSEGNRNGVKVSGPKKITKTGMFNYCWPGCLTVMYNVDTVGLVQVADIKKNNDYAIWLKVCRKANCYLLDEELALYRKYIISVFFSISALLSTSTNAIVIIVLSWAVYLLYMNLKTNEKRNIIQIIAIIIAIVVVVLIAANVSDTFSYGLKRIQLLISGDNASGSAYERVKKGFEIWSQLGFIEKLFGIGFGTYDSYYALGRIHVFNGEIEYMSSLSYILVCSGVIGLALFIIAILNYTKDRSFLKCSLVLLLAVVFLSSSIFNSPIYAIIMLLLGRKKSSISSI